MTRLSHRTGNKVTTKFSGPIEVVNKPNAEPLAEGMASHPPGMACKHQEQLKYRGQQYAKYRRLPAYLMFRSPWGGPMTLFGRSGFLYCKTKRRGLGADRAAHGRDHNFFMRHGKTTPMIERELSNHPTSIVNGNLIDVLLKRRKNHHTVMNTQSTTTQVKHNCHHPDKWHGGSVHLANEIKTEETSAQNTHQPQTQQLNEVSATNRIEISNPGLRGQVAPIIEDIGLNQSQEVLPVNIDILIKKTLNAAIMTANTQPTPNIVVMITDIQTNETVEIQKPGASHHVIKILHHTKHGAMHTNSSNSHVGHRRCGRHSHSGLTEIVKNADNVTMQTNTSDNPVKMNMITEQLAQPSTLNNASTNTPDNQTHGHQVMARRNTYISHPHSDKETVTPNSLFPSGGKRAEHLKTASASAGIPIE
ncbi:hypothetical protein KKF81_06250 [Candidatus Micrarchaeota archaeon]|nr:hypothetical protein [Candidatus Micrarchaeota archaeon]MBU1166531.1 hypothetical protein [Candidatus Micrarchaeota archaeon]MBU1887543.1 hypothetical protein [Candidatus Micrarchaeota archaeon]